jgi:hypothetical protein
MVERTGIEPVTSGLQSGAADTAAPPFVRPAVGELDEYRRQVAAELRLELGRLREETDDSTHR